MHSISIHYRSFFIIYVTFFCLVITSCDGGEMDLAEGFVRTSTYTALIDTVSIELSSIKADSVQTSGRNAGLVGYYNNSLIGSQKATCYFAINVPTGFTWDKDKQIIDSIALIIKPNGYSIGDTTSIISFKVHQLTEQIIKNDNGYLNNVNSFSFEEKPLGEKNILLWPSEEENITIPFSNDFAKELVDFILENKSLSTYSKLFKEEFKGFALQTDTAITNAIIGLNTESDSCKLRLFSHITKLEKEEYTHDFSLLASSYQFTQIEENNLSEPWSKLTSSKVKLSEYNTNAECLIQNGNGYRIRIDFPYLNNLQEIKKQGKIVQASLIIRPIMEYIKYSDLPSTIYINEINKINEVGDYIYNSSGEALTPTLHKDYLYNKNTYYTFDITDYINGRTQETIVDINQGLCISFSDEEAGTQLDYMVIGGTSNQNYKSELYIYYYYYDIKE